MTDPLSNSARAVLREHVRILEELEDGRTNLAASIAGAYADAKAAGLDKKVLRRVVQLRGQDQAKREEFEALVELYEEAARGA